ncbi:AAA family ATPase [Methylobacterium sp. C1]|uniref:AAA family ATPase n=1 Tax=Methylobacterium sp. C1 TaxID=1479019 RepID=UPI0008D97E48|nr:AAA family ATPase [Methylobacterium sp. C1]
MSFTFAPAVRDRVGLVIGLAGPSGSGKTLSALKIARGLAGGDDSRIAFIDTEGGRGKHYAPAPGEAPGPARFGFRHGDLRAPFTPEAYIAAIDAADSAGFEVIVIDSFSHSWDGPGGLQDQHADAVDRAVAEAKAKADEKGWRFDEFAARDKASVGAWRVKTPYRRVVSRLLQCRAHLVICMRADEKLRMETVEEEGRYGKTYRKTVITQAKDLPDAERWVPIVEKRFPYELTTSFVLTPARPGYPVPIKLQEQHRAAVPLDRPLSEETGAGLAAWARGGAAPAEPGTKSASQQSRGGRDKLFADARDAARQGTAALEAFKADLPDRAIRALDSIAAELDRLASNANAADDGFPGDTPASERAA